MVDEDLIARGLEVLENLAAVLMEDALETAVSRVPAEANHRLSRVRELRQAGSDIVAIADACEVLIRRRTAGRIVSQV